MNLRISYLNHLLLFQGAIPSLLKNHYIKAVHKNGDRNKPCSLLSSIGKVFVILSTRIFFRFWLVIVNHFCKTVQRNTINSTDHHLFPRNRNPPIDFLWDTSYYEVKKNIHLHIQELYFTKSLWIVQFLLTKILTVSLKHFAYWVVHQTNPQERFSNLQIISKNFRSCQLLEILHFFVNGLEEEAPIETTLFFKL